MLTPSHPLTATAAPTGEDPWRRVARHGNRATSALLRFEALASAGLATVSHTWWLTGAALAALVGFMAIERVRPASLWTRVYAGIATQAMLAVLLYQSHGALWVELGFVLVTCVLVLYQDYRALLPGAVLLAFHHIWFAVLQNDGHAVYLTSGPIVDARLLAIGMGFGLVQLLMTMIWAESLHQRTEVLARHARSWHETEAELAAQRTENERHSATERAILDAMGDGVIVMSRSGAVLELNAAGQRIMGRTASEMMAAVRLDAQNLMGFYDTAGRRLARTELPSARTLLSGEPVDQVVTGFVHPTLGPRWISSTTRPLALGSDGLPEAIVLTFTDVTAVREAETRLRSSEARKAAVLDATPDAVVTFDAGARLVECNAVAERLFGHTASSALGLDIVDLAIPERLHGAARATLEPLLTGQAPLPEGVFEMIAKRANGTDMPVDVTLVRVPGTEPALFTAFIRDVTARHVHARALRETTDRLTYALEGSNDAIWDWDLTRNRIVRSARWNAIMGWNPDDLPSDLSGWQQIVHPDDEVRVRSALDAHLRGETDAYQAEYRVQRPDGTWTWVLDRGRVAKRDALGNALRVTGAVTDIQERKQAEDALLAAKDAAESASRAKSAFLARMSHELRTPLNSILGFSVLIEGNARSRLSPKERGFLERVVRNGTHLLGLIDQILDLAKIESGRATVRRTSVALSPLLSDCLGYLEPQATAKGLTLVLEGPEPLVPLFIDETMLRQIVLNLLGNAIKFTASGTIRIRVTADGAGRAETVSVIDPGIGIPADRQAAVFEPFEQADGATTRTYGGTGLGLAISRSLAEIMGDRLDIESSPGLGSTFTLRLGAESRGAA